MTTKATEFEGARTQQVLGIDVGGSGIKGAIVDLNSGDFVGERCRIDTPQPATPEAIAETVLRIVENFTWSGPVGITLPGIIKDQRICSAANIDKAWVGLDAQQLFRRHLSDTVELTVLNDADAAGLAEVAHGNTVAQQGPIILLTLGTGIGSAFLLDGQLFPNTELGHLIVGDQEAELQASTAAKERDGLNYKRWTKRLNRVLHVYEQLFSPSAFIIGGGISKKFENWGPLLSVKTPVYPAELRNRAGIVGAAMAASRGIKP